MAKRIITIREAAEILGVSLDSLRRWEKEGKIKSIRFKKGGHRYYDSDEIQILTSNLFKMAKDWVLSSLPVEPKFYCADSSIFQSRLHELETEMQSIPEFKDEFSLITSTVGEIGNNSFDHNLGSWPDIRGIFFAYDLRKKQIVLADRGQGILTTLKRVKPELSDDESALKTAFTEKISGRAPENRGNGLKFVKLVIGEIIKTMTVKLYFQSGNAALQIKNGETVLKIFKSDYTFRGCLILLEF